MSNDNGDNTGITSVSRQPNASRLALSRFNNCPCSTATAFGLPVVPDVYSK
jgi:hypothetical protein